MSPLSLQVGGGVSANTLLVFLSYSSFALSRNDITSLLPASRHLQRMIQPHPSLPPPPCNESVVLTASKCESTQCCGQTVRPLEHLLSVFFWTLCPRAGSRYYNRINVCVSFSVTHLLSQVWQDGFTVNTSLERGSVADIKLRGFHPRHLWNNGMKCLCVVFSSGG